MKVCTRCGDSKPVGEFYKDQSRADGRTAGCKLCIRNASRQYYRNNREKYREHYRNNRERCIQYTRNYQEKNKDAVREAKRLYRAAHRDDRIAYNRQYRKAVGERSNYRFAEIDAATRRAASNHGKPWATSDDAIAIRKDLTTMEKAFMLGRSLHSVKNRIAYLKRNQEQM